MYTAIVTETEAEVEMESEITGRAGLESGEGEPDGDKDAAAINWSQLKFHFGHHFWPNGQFALNGFTGLRMLPAR
ncbi:hypothetical protein M5D96_003695 [Drosophila gunungcola]|uniref:Uncharacterized protein n=1 Tax=Drosophila gunungcola TaxID=103775 RepID=A0A9P9YTB7_9MUSC|nr:hypothetical protein M5D96_003695 [Drosophila gunungcola]